MYIHVPRCSLLDRAKENKKKTGKNAHSSRMSRDTGIMKIVPRVSSTDQPADEVVEGEPTSDLADREMPANGTRRRRRRRATTSALLQVDRVKRVT